MASPTPETEREDSAWAEALAGRPPEGMDPAARRQADLLRAGLQRRKAKLDAAIEEPSEGGFQRLLFRLRREGLDRPSEALPLRRQPFAWGIAASLMLATVFTIQQVGFMAGQDDHLALRGIPDKATIRMVDDLQASQAEMIELLRQAGSEPMVSANKATGDIVIQVDATQAVRDALAGDPLRIYPEIQDGKVTVVLKSTKPKK